MDSIGKRITAFKHFGAGLIAEEEFLGSKMEFDLAGHGLGERGQFVVHDIYEMYN